MSDVAELGVFSLLGLAVSNHASPPADPTYAVEFVSSDLRLRRTGVRTDGIRGTNSVPGNRVLPATRMVEGGFECQPVPADVRQIFPWVFGAAETGSGSVASPYTYAVAESTPYRDLFQYKASRIFKHRECQAARMVLSGTQSQPVSLRLDVMGKDRDDPPGTGYTWPAGVKIDPAAIPWMFYQAVLTIASTPYQFRSFQLEVVNIGSDPARYLNSITPTEFPSAGRDVRLTVDQPFGGNQGLLNTLRDGAAACTLVFTSGLSVLTITLPYLVYEELEDPVVRDREEINFPYTLRAGYTVDGSNNKVDEIKATLSVTA